jgi:hypothetical protein
MASSTCSPPTECIHDLLWNLDLEDHFTGLLGRPDRDDRVETLFRSHPHGQRLREAFRSGKECVHYTLVRHKKAEADLAEATAFPGGSSPFVAASEQLSDAAMCLFFVAELNLIATGGKFLPR